MSEPAIRFEGVCRRFDREIVLNGLDFEVRPGEIYALLGRNGAGKTTAIRILLGLLAPHAGRAFIGGRDSRDLRAEDRGRIGYVGEGQRLHMSLTAKGILAFERSTRPDFDLERAREMIAHCGLPDNRGMLLMSRGQRAQLALITAVCSRPEILILDDPAMGLDTLKRRELLDAMIGFLAEQGGTVLFSSHILGDVERVADRIGILDEGSLVLDATTTDLKTRVRRRMIRASGPLPKDERILRARPRGDALELLLRDEDEALVAALAAAGDLGEPESISLEETFIAVMGGSTGLGDVVEKEALSC